MPELARRAAQLREVSAVGRIVTVDRQDGERTRLTNNSARYEHVLPHNLWVSFETALPQEQFAPREPASNPLSRMINHSSTLKATLFAPPNQRLGTLLCSLCDDTHSSGPARSRFVLRAQPPGRRDGRHRGEHVGHALYSYRPQCDRERPQQDHFRLILSYLRRHRLSRSRMGTFQCRTTKKCAPRPPHASRPPSRAAFPPASTSRPFSLLSDSTSRLHCAKPTAPAHLGENDHDGPHVSAANLVVITTDTESMISSAGGAGRLA